MMKRLLLTFQFAFAVAAHAVFCQPLDISWTRTYGGYSADYCADLAQSSDGGYLLAGSSTSFDGAGWLSPQFWIVKTDQNGDSLWSRTFGGPRGETCESILRLVDGGYLIVGQTKSYISDEFLRSNFWVVRTDSEGDSLWSRSYGGLATDECRSAHQTEDGGYLLAGHSESFGSGDFDFWVVKVDQTGDSLWSRSFGGTESDVCIDIKPTSDSGLVLVGSTRSFGAGGRDIWLIKTTAAGDSLWSHTYGGAAFDEGWYVLETHDLGLIIAGNTRVTGENNRDVWIIKTNANGDSLWSITLGGDLPDAIGTVIQLEDGSYVLGGSTSSFGAGLSDFWLVRTEPDTISDATIPPQFYIPEGFKLSAYPNPFNPTTTISFELPNTGPVSLVAYDLMGRVVSTLVDRPLTAGVHEYLFFATGLSSGSYFVQLQFGKQQRTQKLILLR